MGSSPGAANFFFIWMFNLGIAYGAKVGLKLRLQVLWLQQKTKQALEYVPEADGVVGGVWSLK